MNYAKRSLAKTTLLSISIIVLSCIHTQAVNILAPSDSILGIEVTGSPGSEVINIATEGFGNNQYPANESPMDAIDGDDQTKYLNFGKDNTGIIVTPSAGLSQVTELILTSANDGEDRDPASYQLMGTLNAGSTLFSDYTLIESGNVPIFSSRFETQNISISNTDNYTSYLLYFPTIVDVATAEAMQIAEIQFGGTIIPEASSLAWISSLAVLFLGYRLVQRRKQLTRD